MGRVKLKVGFEGGYEEIQVDVPDDGPIPWDADSKLTVVSKEHPRVNASEIVTGKAKYSTDINLPGMLFAKILRCPFGHARVKSVVVPDLPGIRHVEKYEGKECWFAGDEVGVIVADTQEIAAEAALSTKVAYDVLDHVLDIEQAIKGPSVFSGGNVRKPHRVEQGDIDSAFKSADVVLDRTFSTQVQTHSCLETHSYVAAEEGGKLTVWASTQSVQGSRDQLCVNLRLKANQVRVIGEYVGGGFGSKFNIQGGAIAARLCRQLNRPIKLQQDRAEEHTSNGNRPSSRQRIKAGIKKDGTLTAWQVEVYGNAGLGGAGGGVANPAIYNFGVAHKTHYDVRTNGGPGQPMRAPGMPQGVFAIESMLDDLAHEIRLDPLEVRKKNDPNTVRRAEFDIGAKRIGWERRASPPGSGKGAIKRGIGMASAAYGGIGGPPAEVTGILHADGTFEFHCGAQDIGTGIRGSIAVIAAEELGIKPLDVAVRIGDSDMPYGPASGGSTTAPSVLPAVREAAHLLKKEIAQLAADKLGGEASGYTVEGGRVFSTARNIALKKLAADVPGGKLSVKGKRRKDFKRYRGGVAGCQFAEVEVDTETGIIRVLKVVAVQDCGRIVDRLIAESQIQGAVLQGISFALFEERILDRRTGSMVNPDMLHYKILGPQDVPEIDVVLFEVSNAGNSIGMVGLGEPPIVPTAGAIANAVFNAIGVRVYDLPITPDKVLAALERKR